MAARAAALDLAGASIADLQTAVQAGTLTYEKLTQLCLDRIAAYDHAGPRLNAVITLNPKALETARALDAELERRAAIIRTLLEESRAARAASEHHEYKHNYTGLCQHCVAGDRLRAAKDRTRRRDDLPE